MSVSWLNLHIWIDDKNIRKLIYQRLNKVDWALVLIAHNSKHETKFVWTKNTLYYCVKNDYRSLLEWGWSKGQCPKDPLICAYTAKCGQLSMLQWLRNNNCPWDELTCVMTADKGQLEVLQWARANGCPWDDFVCIAAASNGHLHVLQWARANGCPWDSFTMSDAVEKGHLEVIKWAYTHDCPWDESMYRIARHSKQMQIVEWFDANGFKPINLE